ncbi:MAG: redoxin domain-containing protein [Puniceicoccaceae bacterium]|nr:redoxin domain-containing protein [Puniceicoccaceae bacterium]
MALETGSTAPEFTLKHKNADGIQEIVLSDNYGEKKTVLLFFPLAFSSICSGEMCAVSSNIEEYVKLDAAVYGISVDSPYALEIMAEHNHLKFPLLSDFNKEVSTAYDVLYADFIGLKGVAKRSAFVVNETGTIIYAESSDDPKILPSFTAIKQVLKQC